MVLDKFFVVIDYIIRMMMDLLDFVGARHGWDLNATTTEEETTTTADAETTTVA